MRRIFHRRGFTLVEMLVALTVFSIIALVVSSVFRSAVRTWQAGNSWSEENQAVRSFVRQLAKELPNTANGAPDLLFEGSETEISFLASLDSREGNALGLTRVGYRFDAGERKLRRRMAGKDQGFELKGGREDTVAEGVEDFRFEYAFEPVYESEELRWKKEWRDPKNVPRGVRVTLNGFRTVIFIPTGQLGDDSALLT